MNSFDDLLSNNPATEQQSGAQLINKSIWQARELVLKKRITLSNVTRKINITPS